MTLCRQLATGEKRAAQRCREHGLGKSLLDRWRTAYATDGEAAFAAQPAREAPSDAEGELRAAEARIAQLEAALGRAHLEVELLQRAPSLQWVPVWVPSSRPAPTRKLARLAELLRSSRASRMPGNRSCRHGSKRSCQKP